MLTRLKREEKRLAGEVASLIDDDPLWAKPTRHSASSRAWLTAPFARLLAEAPEIGIVSNKVIAEMVGLSPFANDSGKREDLSYSGRSRRAAWHSLYHCPARRQVRSSSRSSRQRLQKAGKTKMVIRMALA